MHKLKLKTTGEKLRLLCIGAHSDDIEIGCGGSILRILDEYSDVNVDWIVFSANRERAVEAQKSADQFLKKAGSKRIIIENFQDAFFPYIGGEIKNYFKSLQGSEEPHVIFTHNRHDLHQDHRLLSELTWNTFRNHLILEYEIPKWDGDIGQPNFFIEIDTKIAEKKINIISETFKSQRTRDWFTKDLFKSIMRIRGMESRSASGYSEAFYSRKLLY